MNPLKQNTMTLRDASIRIGVCEAVARRLLQDHAVLVGVRKRYPISAIERVAERGGEYITVRPAMVRPEATSR